MDEQRLKNGHVVRQIKKLKNKEHQLAILTAILMDTDLWDLRPIVEHWVKITTSKQQYRIDLYYPQIKLAIEVNETYHKSNKQKEKDKKKEADIKTELSCDFYHINIFEENFIHTDAVSKLKNELSKRKGVQTNFVRWEEKSFDIKEALRDHPNLIFVNKGKNKNPFTPFQLKREYRNVQNLQIAILIDSENQFEGKNIKAIDCVYDATHIEDLNSKNGFIQWSGTTTTHSIQLSGETEINLSNNSYHNLPNRNKKARKKKRKR